VDIPKYFEFCCQVKIVAGTYALEKIPNLLLKQNAKTPMIITDKGVVRAGLIDIVVNAIKNEITTGFITDKVPLDSDINIVNELAGAYREKRCDSIIAVGGGSVLDTAKGINILVSENSDNLMDFVGAGSLKHKLKPLIAVPTTAGTGSEVTLVAVIADHEKKRKMLFTSSFLLPDAAVIDCRMTLSLPPVITAATAMDALTHAVEAYTGLGKNPVSDSYAIEAISLICKNILNVVKNPADKKGRLNLAIAATLAGMAFSNSMVGMAHTLGHSVGSICHVPHGTCMAIFLPYALEYNMHKIGKYISELLFAIAGEDVYAKTEKAERAIKTIQYIRFLNQALYEATDKKHFRFLKEIKNPKGDPAVLKENLDDIAKTALNDGSIFFNPEELDYDDCMMVLDAAWRGIKINPKLIKKG
jgi:alcohol dehydrogenase